MKRICDPSSGKLGNQVYLLGRNGQVVRTRVVPSNPSSSAQTTARANFTTASKGWDLLTQAQQLAWIAAAAALQSKARLGMSGPLTGNQYFVKVNANLLELGSAMVDAPPAAPEDQDAGAVNLVITNTGGTIAVRLTCPTTPSEGTTVLAAAPVRNGVHRCPNLVSLGEIPAPVTGSSTITTQYTARFGVPAVGSKVWVGVKTSANGVDGPLKTFSAVVPTAS